MPDFDNYQGLAEESDLLIGEIRTAMHVLSSRYSIPFDELYTILKPTNKLADSIGQAAHQLWFENDGEFICGECANTCDEPADKKPDFSQAVICAPCQAGIDADHAKTDRMNCVGTPYQY